MGGSSIIGLQQTDVKQKNLYSRFSMDLDFPLLGEKAYTSNIVMMGMVHERVLVLVKYILRKSLEKVSY
jgi:hypothetical protein